MVTAVLDYSVYGDAKTVPIRLLADQPPVKPGDTIVVVGDGISERRAHVDTVTADGRTAEVTFIDSLN